MAWYSIAWRNLGEIPFLFLTVLIYNQRIYWTPKETLQSSLLYHFIKCDNLAFLLFVKVVHDVFEDKRQIWSRFSKAKLLYVDLNGLHDVHDISPPGK